MMGRGKNAPEAWRSDEVFVWADTSQGPRPIATMNAGDWSTEANARLIASSVNAIQTAAGRLGIPAEALAEGLQYGQIADLLETMDEFSGKIKRLKRILHESERRDDE